MNNDQNHKTQLQTELIQAAKIADIETMYTLTKQGADIYELDETGKSACNYLRLQDLNKAITLLGRVMRDIYDKKE